MCSGCERGSYLRFIDFVDHSTLGLRVIKKKTPNPNPGTAGAADTHARVDERLQLRTLLPSSLLLSSLELSDTQVYQP